MTRTSRILTSRNDRILVVDDESFIREGIELYFATEGYKVFVAANGEEAMAILAEESLDVAILDIVMPGMNGIDLLREMKKGYSDVEVIMASGNGTLQTAVEAMRLGAYDYITKPILNFEEDLLKVVRKALERKRLLATNRKLARDLQEVNLELKNANTQLRRRLAELELLSEAGNLLRDLDRLDAFFELVDGTVRYQFEIPHSLLFTASPAGWQLRRAPGCDAVPAGQSALPLDALFGGDPSPPPFLRQPVADAEPLARVFANAGADVKSNSAIVTLPLRALNVVQGAIVILEPVTGAFEERLALLAVLASQLAPPLALLSQKEAPS